MKFETKKELNSDWKKIKTILPKLVKYCYSFMIAIGIIYIIVGMIRWYMQDFEANQLTPMSIYEIHDMGWTTVVIIGMITVRVLFNRYIKIKNV